MATNDSRHGLDQRHQSEALIGGKPGKWRPDSRLPLTRLLAEKA